MALVPIQGISFQQPVGSVPPAGTGTVSATFGVTAGDVIIMSVIGSFEQPGGSQVLHTPTDTQGNGYSTLASVGSLNWSDGFHTVAVYSAVMASTGSNTITATSTTTGSLSKSLNSAMGQYRNVDTTVSPLVAILNAAVSGPNWPQVTTTHNNAEEIGLGSWSNVNGLTPVITNGWSQPLSTGTPARPLFNLAQGQPGLSPTFNLTNGVGGYYLVNISFASLGATDPNNGNVFLGTASLPMFGMTWLKNACLLARDYWDSGLVPPYQGQLYPAPNANGTQSGQAYPVSVG